MTSNLKMVPGAGVEPAWPRGRGILSPLRLPVSPPGRVRPGDQRATKAIELACAQATMRIESMEAWVGIEPAYTALQAAA